MFCPDRIGPVFVHPGYATKYQVGSPLKRTYPDSLGSYFQGIRKYGGESGIVLAANSKITLKMQKSIDPPAIAVI